MRWQKGLKSLRVPILKVPFCSLEKKLKVHFYEVGKNQEIKQLFFGTEWGEKHSHIGAASVSFHSRHGGQLGNTTNLRTFCLCHYTCRHLDYRCLCTFAKLPMFKVMHRSVGNSRSSEAAGVPTERELVK